MKLGYVILYVDDVVSATKFYAEAFGIPTRFVHDGGDYAELDTGETTLAFASHALGSSNFPSGYTKLTDLTQPAGSEIAFVTDDVAVALSNAVAAGGTMISGVQFKPWGQSVAYVRAPDGCVIELCSPVGG